MKWFFTRCMQQPISNSQLLVVKAKGYTKYCHMVFYNIVVTFLVRIMPDSCKNRVNQVHILFQSYLSGPNKHNNIHH